MNRLDLSSAQRQLNDFGYSKQDSERILNEMQDRRDEARAMADDSSCFDEGDDE